MKRPCISRAPMFVQVLALALAAVVAAQLVNVFMVLHLPEPPPRGFALGDAARALQGETVRLRSGRVLVARVTNTPPDWVRRGRPLDRVITRLLAQELGVAPARIRATVQSPRGPVRRIDVQTRVFRREMREELHALHVRERPLGGEVRILRDPEPRGDVFRAALFPPFSAALQLPDGRWSVIEPPKELISAWQRRLLVGFGLTALVVVPVAWWFAGRLTRPIRAFAEAAERLGADPNAPPAEAEGPSELRTAVAAFNDMQEKLRRYVQGRTEMVAAIAHDLRTPLARLRFRAEGAPDAVREKMNADIAEMDGMIASVLAFVRAERAPEARVPLDLGALAASVVHDFAEQGGAASISAADAVTVVGDSLPLKRLVANLVENALKFGGAARVSLARNGAIAVLAVEDDGPGLPEDELERVFEPFRRAEPSRNRDTGGAGLGLAVARAIARAHGGDVVLRNRPGGGLRAEVSLPI